MRHFLKALLALPLLAFAASSAVAQARIGLALPNDDVAPILAAQMRAGAEEAAAAVGATLVIETEVCTAQGGEQAARRLVGAGIDAVVGFLCTEAIEAALPILTEADIPAIATGIRTDSLTDRRERTGWQIYRLAPRADGEREAAARYVVENWRDVLFAVVDDGTIYGREIAETVRIAAEESGLMPVFIDTFRPQLDNQIGLIGRLHRSGATHVFVGGDREDVAIMARDADGLDYDLTIAGGEALRAATGQTDLTEGILMIASQGAELDRDLETPVGRLGYFFSTHAAVEIAAEAASQGDRLAEIIASERFETIIGPVAFDAKGDIMGTQYRTYRFDGSQFLPSD